MTKLENVAKFGLSEYLAQKAIHMKVPLSGTFELSPVCNLSCRMCYVRKTEREIAASPRAPLKLDTWRRLAREAKEAGTLYLLLTGGEPLLWPDFETLYTELCDMGFLVSVNTNGTLIDSRWIKVFRDHPPYRINITLYGASNDTYRRLCSVDGVFEKVCSAVRELKAADIPLKLNCSLTPHNECDLEWIVDFARSEGVKLTTATYMFPPVRRDATKTGVNDRFTPEESARNLLRYLGRDRGSEAFKRYINGIVNGCVDPPGLDESCTDPVDGKIRCRAGRASFWITWDGMMTPCGMMPEPKTDVVQSTFADAWQKTVEKAAALRLSGVCTDCPNAGICHPCAAIAYAETGSTEKIPEYMCKVSRELLRLAREIHEN